MSLISVSPKSECLNSFFILSCLFCLVSLLFLGLDETYLLTSSSITLPSFSLPATWVISTPSSLANFRAFGLADDISLDKFLTWLIEVCSISGFITLIFLNSFSTFGFSSEFSFIADFSSKINIKSPSETLSPTFIFKVLILPSKFDGISTLDLSLSIVIRGSFFF